MTHVVTLHPRRPGREWRSIVFLIDTHDSTDRLRHGPSRFQPNRYSAKSRPERCRARRLVPCRQSQSEGQSDWCSLCRRRARCIRRLVGSRSVEHRPCIPDSILTLTTSFACLLPDLGSLSSSLDTHQQPFPFISLLPGPLLPYVPPLARVLLPFSRLPYPAFMSCSKR